MDNAFLLGRYGAVIPVLNHPNEDFEFESVVRILKEYTDAYSKAFVEENRDKNCYKSGIMELYNNAWCKVRVWENGKLITFRIASTDGFDWYRTIKSFLLNNPTYKISKVTVEADKRTGDSTVFWDEISYDDAISPKFETLMTT